MPHLRGRPGLPAGRFLRRPIRSSPRIWICHDPRCGLVGDPSTRAALMAAPRARLAETPEDAGYAGRS